LGTVATNKLQLAFLIWILSSHKRRKIHLGNFAEKGEEYFRYKEKDTLEELVLGNSNSFFLRGGHPVFSTI
jgi:shikimate kinase